jgi:hypothetical protein
VEALKPNGIVGIIVSNRFMTTKSGAAVREDILKNFDVQHIWDLGDTKIFAAAVLPAVLLLKKRGKIEVRCPVHRNSRLSIPQSWNLYRHLVPMS